MTLTCVCPALQQALYSGYVCGHCVTWHVVTAPDGIIMHCYGPCAGRLNDLNILDDSRLLRTMAERPGACTTYARTREVQPFGALYVSLCGRGVLVLHESCCDIMCT